MNVGHAALAKEADKEEDEERVGLSEMYLNQLEWIKLELYSEYDRYQRSTCDEPALRQVSPLYPRDWWLGKQRTRELDLDRREDLVQI